MAELVDVLIGPEATWWHCPYCDALVMPTGTAHPPNCPNYDAEEVVEAS
jgi:hypothetical protein